jgi:hypothetical protein
MSVLVSLGIEPKVKLSRQLCIAANSRSGGTWRIPCGRGVQDC